MRVLVPCHTLSSMQLIIFSGLQASGKSTFYETVLAPSGDYGYVSKDRLRHNPRPGRRQAQLIEEALGAGRSVVVDNTNPTAVERGELIALGRRFGALVIGYWFASSVAGSVERNRRREGRARVPNKAVYITAHRLTPPTYAEGFDLLYLVRIVGESDARGESGEGGESSGRMFAVTKIERNTEEEDQGE